VFYGIIPPSLKRSLKYLLHLPKMSFDLLSKTRLYISGVCRNIRYFAAEKPYDLTEHFAGLPVIGMHFWYEIFPRLHFGLLHSEFCGLAAPLRTARAEKIRISSESRSCRLLSLYE